MTRCMVIDVKIRGDSILIHDEGQVVAEIILRSTHKTGAQLAVLYVKEEIDIDREKVFRREFPLEKLLKED